MLNKPLDILLVEDSAADRELMTLALDMSLFPYTLNFCEDGEQALQYFHKEPPFQSVMLPDLVLLDLNLPKKTGYEVIEQMKTNPTLRTIPVIVLTTTALDKDIQRVSSYGGIRFYTKPFRFDEYKVITQTIKDFWCSHQDPSEAFV